MSAALRRHLAVWLSLLVLLALSVASTAVAFGPFAPVVNFGIALAKATLVAWVFMRLKSEKGLGRLMAIGALGWVAVLVALIAADLAFQV